MSESIQGTLEQKIETDGWWDRLWMASTYVCIAWKIVWYGETTIIYRETRLNLHSPKGEN